MTQHLFTLSAAKGLPERCHSLTYFPPVALKSLLLQLGDKTHVHKIFRLGVLRCRLFVGDLGEDRLHPFSRDVRRIFQILTKLIVGVFLNFWLLYLQLFLIIRSAAGLLFLNICTPSA